MYWFIDNTIHSVILCTCVCLHCHSPGLILTQVFFWSNDSRSRKQRTMTWPESLHMLLVMHDLHNTQSQSREGIRNGTVKCWYSACVYTHCCVWRVASVCAGSSAWRVSPKTPPEMASAARYIQRYEPAASFPPAQQTWQLKQSKTLRLIAHTIGLYN